MNFLWPILIIISFIISLLSGNIDNVNNSIFSSVSDVINLTLTLIGNMCLWCGLIKIIQETKLMKIIKKALQPILNWLYPEARSNKKAMENISINMVSNILGIGNAATPAGIKAMQELQEQNTNKEELSNSMLTLIVLNTTSLQLIPTTIIAIRSSLGSAEPTNIIFPIWISTIVGTLVGVTGVKILCNIRKNKNIKK